MKYLFVNFHFTAPGFYLDNKKNPACGFKKFNKYSSESVMIKDTNFTETDLALLSLNE